MHYFKILGLCFLGLLITVQTAWAGAWPKAKGTGYAQVSFTYLKYNKVTYSTGAFGFEQFDLKRPVLDLTLQGYLEYGLTNKLTVVGAFPLKFTATGNPMETVANPVIPNSPLLPAGTLNGLSNIFLAAKYGFYNEGVVISGQLGLRTGTANIDNLTGLRTGFDSWAFIPSVQIGAGLNKGYFSGELGFEYRTNNYSHNFLARAEYGYGVTWNEQHKTYFVAAFEALIPFNNGTYDDGTAAETALYQSRLGYALPGIKINHNINKNWWVNIGSYGAALYINQGGAAPSVTIGLAYEW